MSKGMIAFPITPMDADGRVDAQTFRRLLRRLVEAQVDGVCVLGSTGSYPYLARDERRRALDIAATELGGRIPLSAGVGALRTDHAVACAQDAAQAGATLGLLAPVSYTPLTDGEVFTHFETVAAQGGLPLCIYDNPAATHFAISDALLGRLAAIPNVVAVKAAAPPPHEAAARIATLRALTSPDFSIGFAVDWNAAAALTAGADAWYSVLGGLFPAPVMEIRRAAAAGDAEEATHLTAALEPMWALMRKHSGLRVIYAAAEADGLCLTQPPRPLLPLDADAKAEVAAVLASLRPRLEAQLA